MDTSTQTLRRTELKQILSSQPVGQEVYIMGWVKAFRSNRFISLNDGSTMKDLQVVVDFEQFDEALLKKISFHSSIAVQGEVVESKGAGQAIEVVANEIEILGE